METKDKKAKDNLKKKGERKTAKPLCGRDIFSLFLQHRLTTLPIVEHKKITHYLDKAKLFSMQTIDSFLNQAIDREKLKKLYGHQEETKFFDHLTKENIQKVPFILLEKDLITSYTLNNRNFFYHFNPVKKLAKDDFQSFFNVLKTPVIIYNCFLEPLFINREASTFLKRKMAKLRKEGKPKNQDENSLAVELGKWLIEPILDFKKKTKREIEEEKKMRRTLNGIPIDFFLQKLPTEKSVIFILSLPL